MKQRPTAVAGLFYPGEPNELRAAVNRYVKEGVASAIAPKAVIAPHAGYAYSGPIAGSAYAAITRLKGIVRRVLLLGPAHRVPISGLALSSAEEFETPLGNLAVDQDAAEQLRKLPQVIESDEAHANEHSLEVQLPFLLETLGPDIRLVPLVAGEVSAEEVAEAIAALWDGQTLPLVSSDLSHFLEYREAVEMDAQTARAIEGLKPDAIRYQHACGGLLIKGLLRFAAAHSLRAKTIDLRNSGDISGDRDRVVGYGAFLFE